MDSINYDTTLPEKKVMDFGMMVGHREHERDSSSQSNLATTPSEPAYRETGPMINRSNTAEALKESNSALQWPRIRRAIREPLSEFMGTFILIMFGDGVVAQVLLSGGLSTDPSVNGQAHGNYQSISWGWVRTLITVHEACPVV